MASKNTQEQLISTQMLLIQTLSEQVSAERSRADAAEQHNETLRERIRKLRTTHNGSGDAAAADDAREERRREKSAKQAAATARVSPSSPPAHATVAQPAKDKKPRGPKKCKTCSELYTAFKCPSVECAAKRAKQKEADDAKKAADTSSSSLWSASGTITF